MAANEVIRILPTVEALCDNTKGRPKCSVKNKCKKVYHCPIETCKYHEDMSFQRIKFLKQHYVKVHKTKVYTCAKCDKNFPLESTLKRHQLICGVKYRCHCNAQFNAYEAFLTHAKRKNHGTILKYKDMMNCIKTHTTAQDVQKHSDNTLKIRAIIVEDPQQQKLVILKKRANAASTKETQTGMKMCKILPKVSSETQTMEEERENAKKTVSMQTNGSSDHVRKRRRSRIHDSVARSKSNVSFSTSGTQTTPIKEDALNAMRSKKRPSRTEKYPLMSQLSSATLEYRSSSSLYKKKVITGDPNLGSMPDDAGPEESKICSAETQTDTNDKEDCRGDDFNLIFYADNETQTAFEDYFDNSYMDTYTQTCDSLFFDLDVVDIQTQTSWSVFDDTLKKEEFEKKV